MDQAAGTDNNSSLRQKKSLCLTENLFFIIISYITTQ